MNNSQRSVAALELAILLSVAAVVLLLPSLPTPTLRLQLSAIACLMLVFLALAKYYGQVRS